MQNGGGNSQTPRACSMPNQPPADAALCMLSLRLLPGSPFLTYLAVKTHKQKPEEADQRPRLFLSGVPLNFDETSIGAIFACFGTVLQVVLHGNKRSGMVVFEEPSALTAVLSSAENKSIVEWSMPEDSESAAGVKAWVHQHKALRPGNTILQKELDTWIQNFEEEEIKREKHKKASMAEDGWTMVVRSKGRAKTAESDGGMLVKGGGMAAAAAAREGKAKGQAVEGNFYRFQQRDKRRNDLFELRKQFEQDRRRIAEMRQSRNFKPA